MNQICRYFLTIRIFDTIHVYRDHHLVFVIVIRRINIRRRKYLIRINNFYRWSYITDPPIYKSNV